MRPRVTWVIVGGVVLLGFVAGVDALRSLGDQSPQAEASVNRAVTSTTAHAGGTSVKRIEYPFARARRKLERTAGVRVVEEARVRMGGRSARRYVLVVDPPEFDGLLGIPANSFHLGDLYHPNRVELVLLDAGGETLPIRRS